MCASVCVCCDVGACALCVYQVCVCVCVYVCVCLHLQGGAASQGGGSSHLRLNGHLLEAHAPLLLWAPLPPLVVHKKASWHKPLPQWCLLWLMGQTYGHTFTASSGISLSDSQSSDMMGRTYGHTFTASSGISLSDSQSSDI